MRCATPRPCGPRSSAAETGHLVLLDAAHDGRDRDDQPRSSTSSRRTSSSRCACRSPTSLRGIVSPAPARAAPTSDGRVPAMEVLVATGRVFDKIANADADPRDRGDHRRRRVLRDADLRPEPAATSTSRASSTRATRWRRRRTPHDLRLKLEHLDLEPRRSADLEGEPPPPRRHVARRRSCAGTSAARRVTMAAMTAIPPRLAPLLAPGLRRRSRSRRALTDAGYECYLVGGTVRDALVGRERRRQRHRLRDRRPPEAIEALLAADRPTRVWLAGQRFGTVGAHRRRRARARSRPSAPTCTTPRAASPRSSFGDDIETDLSRRDFTVNAMALRLPGARCSSTRSTARSTSRRAGCARRSSPDVSFTDDPLRMLRAARFIAALRARARRPSSSPRSASTATGSRS